MIKGEKTSYRQIFKSTSIFGGVQLFLIVINLLKTKIIALMLGPTGIGLLGLLTSAVEMLKTIIGVGVETGAVKELSEADAVHHPETIAKTLITLRRCMWITATTALLATLLLAPWLSRWSFNTREYTLTFTLLSIAVFFDLLCTGQVAALRGMRRIGDLAKAKIMGAVSGLIISLPLFWIIPSQAIVLFLIITLGASSLFAWIFARKIIIAPIRVTWLTSLHLGGKMAKLGVAMSLSSAAGIITVYLIKTYITHSDGIAEAGIYQSAFSLAEGYFGLIFTAMATDYFPRLAANNQNNKQIADEVNRQTEIGLLIVLPCIIAALFFLNFIVELLYSSNFLPAVSCMKWILLGNIFKITSWSLSYVLIATGKSFIFATCNLISTGIFLFITLTGYRLWGVEGTGIAFFIYYLFFFVEMLLLIGYQYRFTFRKPVWKIMGITLSVSLFAFIIEGIEQNVIKYSIGVISTIVTSSYVWREINRRISLKEWLYERFRKRKE